MNSVLVKVSDLIDTLKRNREKHRESFEVALTGWEDKVIEELSQAQKNASDRVEFKTKFDLPQPQSHLKDYDRALGMLGMHIGETITLNSAEYEQYVEDNWNWKQSFAATNSRYAVV